MAYLDKTNGHSLNSRAMGLTLAVNGGVIAALVLVAPQVAADLPIILQGYEVVPDPAPVPPPPVDKKTPPPAKPTAPPDLTPVTIADPSPLQGPLFDPAPLDEGLGKGAGLVEPKADPDPAPARKPVMSIAKPDPRHAALLQPPYPTSMIRAGLGGVVVVRVLVGTDGRVKAIEPVSASEEAFLKATREQALSKWRFQPATSDGQPVESWREMTVRFVLPD